MDWQKQMNRAMNYIENHLLDDIDYSAAAQLVNSSVWEFQRIFSCMAQIPLSEYIRRRRLTMAAADIQNGDKIIDVAMRYGYRSQTAFSRAFSRLHGVSPSMARDKKITPKAYPRLTFKLILMEGISMDQKSDHRSSIIGGCEAGCAVEVDLDGDTVHQTNRTFWDTKGNETLGAIVLPFYGAFVSEESCHLLGEVAGKKVLDIGCGTGGSLQYIGEHQASELWGVDLSEQQLEKAKLRLSASGLTAKLICSSMEAECGIPPAYFDIVYSVYAIGWTTDLEGTFRRIASYLKKDGVFIFSWSHPIHKCVVEENGMLEFKKCYFDESWYTLSLNGGTMSMSDRKLSTYVNALARAGFLIEQLVEQSDDDILQKCVPNDPFANKARQLPVTFVLKARKL